MFISLQSKLYFNTCWIFQTMNLRQSTAVKYYTDRFCELNFLLNQTCHTPSEVLFYIKIHFYRIIYSFFNKNMALTFISTEIHVLYKPPILCNPPSVAGLPLLKVEHELIPMGWNSVLFLGKSLSHFTFLQLNTESYVAFHLLLQWNDCSSLSLVWNDIL